MHNSNNSALSKDTIFGALNHTDISFVLNNSSILEEISVAKAKEAMQVFSNLGAAVEATEIFNERKAKKLPANIKETPQFHQAKSESLELSASAKETFARIGARAREAFVEE